MAVKPKLRWAILRRDNFACRYCGATAEGGAVLHIDHVTPRVRGGKDIPQNLVTACEACNFGKSDVPLDAPLAEDVPQAEFRLLCTSHDAPPPRGSKEFEDFETEAAVAWSREWQPAQRDWGFYCVSFELAVAAGRGRSEVLEACEAAGQRQRPAIGEYMSYSDQTSDGPEEDAAYDQAIAYLARFIPSERCMFIRHARELAGAYQPNETQVIRAAGTVAHQFVEDPGRDRDALKLWLMRLPEGEGARRLTEAAKEWDEAYHGNPRDSSYYFPDEVLEIAVALALGAEVPA